MHSSTHAAGRGRRAAAGALALALALAASIITAPAAQAAEQGVDDVTLSWSINDESGGGAFFGGCNFLSAGEAGNTGSSRLWTEADGFYQASDGDVSIRKPDGEGGWNAPTWATKCQNAQGSTVNTQPGSTTGTEVVFSNGSGTVDLDAGTAEVTWNGSVTIVYYGGLTYWSISDPVLTVDADGAGTLTGTASGYGADMFDPSLWVELDSREIEVATLSGVAVTEDGFTVTPEYLGVEVEVQEDGPSGPQIRTGDHWGAFPQSFVDFNVETGQAAYWYSSGGLVDPKKPTTPLTVAWTAESGDPGDPDPGDPDPGEPGEGEIEIGVTVPEDDGDPDPGEPGDGEFSWTIQGTGIVNLGEATATSAGFTASGQLHPVQVTDTREDAPAWSINGQASDFTSGTDSFGAVALGWQPSLTDDTVGAVAGDAVVAGSEGLAQARTLVSAPAGHDLGSVTVHTALDLLAPSDSAAGDYTSTLTLTAIG